MRKVKGAFILFLFLSFFNVQALGGSVNFSCDKNKVSTNDTVTCSLTYNVTDGSIKGFGADISTDGVEISSVSKGANWQGAPTNSKIGVYTDTGLTGNVSIVTITGTIKASSGSPSITISNIDLADENDNSSTASNKVATFSIASSDAGITALMVDQFDITSTKSYTANVASVNVSVNKSNQNATVSGDGVKNLSCGANNFEITVTAEAGNSEKYPFTINRTCGSDATLNSLTVGRENLNFSSNKTDYTVNVNSSTTTIRIDASATDSKATVTGDVNKEVNLNYGNNVFNIHVAAEDGTGKDYKVTIVREDNRDSDNTLASLSIKDVKIDFKKTVTSYNATVEKDVASVSIDAKATSSKATVSGDLGKKDLVTGSNKFTITVTAENETKKDYTIIIVRKSEEKLDEDNTLKNIVIKGMELDFATDKLKYTVNLEEMTEKLDIEAVATSSKATVTIVGNDKLKAGKNKITIEVMSESGSIKEYIIEVNLPSIEEVEEEQEKSILTTGKDDNVTVKKKNNSWIIIVCILLVVVILIIIIILLLKKKNEQEKIDTPVSLETEKNEIPSNNEEVVTETPAVTPVNEEVKENPVVDDSAPEIIFTHTDSVTNDEHKSGE